MFKFLLPFLVAFSFPLEVLSGQFGLEMGDTKRDIEKKGVKLIDVGDYFFMTYKVPKGNSNLKMYSLMISPNNGLCKIMTGTEDLPTNDFGTSIKNKFEFFESLLSKKYGENRKSDYVASGSMWNKEKYWTMGLLKKERVLRTEWDSRYGSKLPQNNVNNIVLSAGAKDTSIGIVGIQYKFSNYSACNEEYETAQSDSL